MTGRRAPTADDLIVEIDGAGVEPQNLDAEAALALAAAYVRLVAQVAEDEGLELSFTGLDISNKCAAIVVTVSDPDAAQQASRRAARYVNQVETPPKGALGLARDVRQALGRLPSGQVARVGSLRVLENLGASAAFHEYPPEETLAVRAKPVRVGGSKPAARFESHSEQRAFTLHMSEDDARKLGRHLYKWVDLVATVARDPDGNIERGQLTEFQPVLDDDASTAWREWYRDHASDWDGVADIERELDRDSD